MLHSQPVKVPPLSGWGAVQALIAASASAAARPPSPRLGRDEAALGGIAAGRHGCDGLPVMLPPIAVRHSASNEEGLVGGPDVAATSGRGEGTPSVPGSSSGCKRTCMEAAALAAGCFEGSAEKRVRLVEVDADGSVHVHALVRGLAAAAAHGSHPHAHAAAAPAAALLALPPLNLSTCSVAASMQEDADMAGAVQ